MNANTLAPVPLTSERFAPFGDVVDRVSATQGMNDNRFERFADLARVDVDGQTGISIARSRSATRLPYRFDLLERHPLGSQAFIPLAEFVFIVVVAPAGETVDERDLRAFVTNGRQGVNYHRGVWHVPLIALQEGQEFLVVDRSGNGDNCEELILGETVTLERG